MQNDDSGVILPRPYGEAFDIDDGLDELIASRLNRMEKWRRFWGRLANTWFFTLIRNMMPTMAIFTAVAVMALPDKVDPSVAAFVSASLTFFFISPSVITSNFSLWVGLDRLGARGRTRDERDSSIERILNTLTESRLHEHMRFSNLLAYSFLLWLADRFPLGDETRGLLLVGSILAASIAVAHSILVERRTPNHSDDLPFLVHHAPSQHKSTLQDPLTEILVAHLDPESASRFTLWKQSIVGNFTKKKNPNQSIEHILHLVYLHGQNMILHNQLVQEFEKLVGPKKVKDLILENPHLDIPTLSRLMGHTRAWQSDLFRQMDRLQFER